MHARGVLREKSLARGKQPAQAGQTARLTLQLSDSGGQSLFTGSFDRYLPGT